MQYEKKASRNTQKRSEKILEEKESYFPNGNIKNLKAANLERFLMRKCVADLSYDGRKTSQITICGWGSGEKVNTIEKTEEEYNG